MVEKILKTKDNYLKLEEDAESTQEYLNNILEKAEKKLAKEANPKVQYERIKDIENKAKKTAKTIKGISSFLVKLGKAIATGVSKLFELMISGGGATVVVLILTALSGSIVLLLTPLISNEKVTEDSISRDEMIEIIEQKYNDELMELIELYNPKMYEIVGTCQNAEFVIDKYIVNQIYNSESYDGVMKNEDIDNIYFEHLRLNPYTIKVEEFRTIDQIPIENEGGNVTYETEINEYVYLYIVIKNIPAEIPEL